MSNPDDNLDRQVDARLSADRAPVTRTVWRVPVEVMLYIAIFSLLALRCNDAIIYPALEFEDGPIMLGYFFHNGDSRSILRNYAGYVSVFQNAVAYIAARGPLPLVPYIFAAVSLAIAALCPFICSRDWFSWWIPRRTDRVLIALLIAVLPLGDRLLITNLNYLQWNLLFILLLMLLATLPRTTGGLVAYGGALAVCALSHPLSVLAFPLCIGRFLLSKNPSQRLCMALVAAAILVNYTVFVEPVVKPPATLSSLMASTYFAAKVWSSRVIFELAFGTQAAIGPNYWHWLFTIGLGIAIALAMLATAADRRRPRWTLPLLVCVMALCLAMVWAATTLRYTGLEAHYYMDSTMGHRYVYVPKLMMTFFLLSFVVPAITKCLAQNGRAMKLASATAVGAYLLAINVDNRSLYWSRIGEGPRLAAFLETVERNLRQAERGEPYVNEHRLARERDSQFGAFDIELNIDAHLGKLR